MCWGGSLGVLVQGGHSDLVRAESGPDVLCREKMGGALWLGASL